MPTNSTAVFTRGWWPVTLADPSNAVYDAGWFLQPDVEVIAEATFTLRGPFGELGLVAAVAYDRSLGSHIGLAIQLPTSSALVLAARSVLDFTFGLTASEEYHDLL